jgi:hypothetical protein
MRVASGCFVPDSENDAMASGLSRVETGKATLLGWDCFDLEAYYYLPRH